MDILEDGSLDLPDEVLGRLDLVVGAVHSQFDLSRAKQTERILRAMDIPHFTLLAHPSGRLIDEREPYDVDMLRIIRQAQERGCFLELNAHPERLDLLDSQCQMAKEEGVLVSINSDAHSTLRFFQSAVWRRPGPARLAGKGRRAQHAAAGGAAAPAQARGRM